MPRWEFRLFGRRVEVVRSWNSGRAGKTSERRNAATLSAISGALSARLHCLTLDCSFSRALNAGSLCLALGRPFWGAERHFLESHHACLPSELTLSVISSRLGRNRHRNTLFDPSEADLDAEAPIFNF
ncbi:hypothetical protein LR48_Vigan02g086800 [Vigna angularis]|uniref:Uncharacterized protein n=1 Tax=Phaseolus angularis TaxID=3914 RepID=A0A0L9TVU9_PHAAN|nr:hypothetical protein LR48_Vigan02g086800 [Vigna angularis]